MGSETASVAVALSPESSLPQPPAQAREVDPKQAWPDNDSETMRVLLAMAHRRTGRIPRDLLARHVLSVTSGGDWPLRRCAMEAVLRRCKSADNASLAVKCRSARRGALGDFTVGRPTARGRSYEVRIACVDPLEASCDCNDFLRNSLGLCKHVIAVMQKRRVEGLTGGQRWVDPGRGKRLASVGWSPVRPLTGPGDWLERIQIQEARAAGGRPMPAGLKGALIPREGCTWGFAEPVLRDPGRRLEAVELLLRHMDGDGGGARRAAFRPAPAVRALLAHERGRLDVAVRSRPDEREIRQALRALKRKLYPYQIEGVRAFLRSGRLLLADDMGLGKTAQAIAACHVLFHAGRVRTGVIITPASLKSQWLREWGLFTDVPARIVEGTASDRERIWRKGERGFLITNYEQVLRDIPSLRRQVPDIVVLDEAQRIKNWETKTSQCVKELKPRYRLVLTGTPMENRLDELASVVEWVDDLALEPKWRLVPWHATAVDGQTEVGGARHIATLRQRMDGSVLRRTRETVLDQLPSRTDTAVPVEFTSEQLDEHSRLVRPIVALVRIARSRPLTQAEFLRLMQLLTTQRIIANGIALHDFEAVWPDLQKIERPANDLLRTLSTPKLLELREIIRHVAVEQNRKVVVFSQWRRMLVLAHWATREILEAAGARAAFFTGEESQQQRARNVVDLHDCPRTRVLFLTDCGGVGLNLQRAASCCINLDLPWNPAVLEQRVGRIHRMGQTRPIDIYNLVSEEPSIESRIASLVEDKRALFKGLFDGDGDEIRYERSGTFMGRIEKMVATPSSDPAAGVADDDPEDDIESLASAAEGAPPAEAAFEPFDGVAAAANPPEAAVFGTMATSSGSLPEELPLAARVAAELAIADPVAGAPPAALSPTPDPFAGVTISRRPDGGLVLDAKPDAAAALSTLFEGFARLLRTASG